MLRISMLLVVCVLLGEPSARADRYDLKSGGYVEGELIARPDDGSYVIKTPDGARLAFERADVVRVTVVDDAATEYARRSREMHDTIEAHRALADWCRTNKLDQQRDHHLQRVLQFDPNDEEARLGLGYQKRGGRWLNRAELMRVRGMELYEGKYRTSQEIVLLERAKQNEGAAQDWTVKLRLWRDWLDSRREDRVAEARLQIASLDDPLAAPSIVRLLEREQDEWVVRQYVAALGRLDHPSATQTLVRLALHDEDAEIREECRDLLTRNGRVASIYPFVQALKSKNNEIVNRAASALEVIGNPDAVSPLIDALVTTHRFRIEGNSDRISAGMSNGSGGLSFGGNGPKIISKDLRNPQVLRALTSLTHQSGLDYDETAWRDWFVNQQMSADINSRRDL
ncbi:MAG: HEAT repeat domain-containing protein [Planctomycetales bacterium]|nr:HEAT repeat domain-containing protein [Planctomycetales bacterium]